MKKILLLFVSIFSFFLFNSIANADTLAVVMVCNPTIKPEDETFISKYNTADIIDKKFKKDDQVYCYLYISHTGTGYLKEISFEINNAYDLEFTKFEKSALFSDVKVSGNKYVLRNEKGFNGVSIIGKIYYKLKEDRDNIQVSLSNVKVDDLYYHDVIGYVNNTEVKNCEDTAEKECKPVYVEKEKIVYEKTPGGRDYFLENLLIGALILLLIIIIIMFIIIRLKNKRIRDLEDGNDYDDNDDNDNYTNQYYDYSTYNNYSKKETKKKETKEETSNKNYSGELYDSYSSYNSNYKANNNSSNNSGYYGYNNTNDDEDENYQ